MMENIKIIITKIIEMEIMQEETSKIIETIIIQEETSKIIEMKMDIIDIKVMASLEIIIIQEMIEELLMKKELIKISKI